MFKKHFLRTGTNKGRSWQKRKLNGREDSQSVVGTGGRDRKEIGKRPTFRSSGKGPGKRTSKITYPRGKKDKKGKEKEGLPTTDIGVSSRGMNHILVFNKRKKGGGFDPSQETLTEEKF